MVQLSKSFELFFSKIAAQNADKLHWNCSEIPIWNDPKLDGNCSVIALERRCNCSIAIAQIIPSFLELLREKLTNCTETVLNLVQRNCSESALKMLYN